MRPPPLTLRQRATWTAHALKAATQNHHREIEAFFAARLPRDAWIADVGAHAGQFAKAFARIAPQGRVFAFEPSSYALSILRIAMAANGYRHVQIEPYGLSDAPGRFEMSTPLKKSGSVGFGLAHLGEADGKRPVRTETIEVRRLDDVAPALGFQRLDLIKADIEGWEGRMLAGASETITRFKPMLFLELVDESLARGGDRAEAIAADLEARGYRAQQMYGDKIISENGYSGPGDYLFVPT